MTANQLRLVFDFARKPDTHAACELGHHCIEARVAWRMLVGVVGARRLRGLPARWGRR